MVPPDETEMKIIGAVSPAVSPLNTSPDPTTKL